MTVGVVDVLDRLADPDDGMFGEPEHQPGMAVGDQIGKGVERRFHAGGPAGRLGIVDKASGAEGAVERLAQTALQGLAVRLKRGGGHLEPAEQGRVALGQGHDHPGQSVDALGFEMIPDAPERAAAVRPIAVTGRVGGQRRRRHVLAKPPVPEGRTGALASDVRAPPGAPPGDHGAVILASRDPGQHAIRLEAQNFDLPGAKIGLGAGKHLFARKRAHRVDIEAGWFFGCHQTG